MNDENIHHPFKKTKTSKALVHLGGKTLLKKIMIDVKNAVRKYIIW